MWKSIGRSAVAILLCVLAVSCDSGGLAGPAPVASVVIGAPPEALRPGESVALAATLRDAAGSALTGRAVVWRSADVGVATVDGAGVVTAVSAGTTVIAATAEGRQGVLPLTVLPTPVAVVTVAAASASLEVGSTVQVVASTFSASGQVLSGRAIQWATDRPDIATVDGAGLVTAIALGTVNVVATTEGRSATLSLTVRPTASAPTVSAIVPSVLVPGSIATITGTGFDPLASGNVVTVGGVTALVSSASATQLVVTIPCVPGGVVPLQVAARGFQSAVVTGTLDVTPRTLAVGESLVLTSSASSACTELVTSELTARYLLTVFSTGTTANSLVDVDIVGAARASVLSIAGVLDTTRSGARTIPDASPRPAMALGAVDAADAARDQRHFAMLERDRADYLESRARERARGARATAGTTGAMVRAAALPEVGDMRTFSYTYEGGCNDVSRPVRARAIYVGTRAIIWEDSVNTLPSTSDESLARYYGQLGRMFDTDQYESVKRNFGDPLRRDDVTDADGRVHRVFTERVNSSGIAAYVTSCDQFPVSVNRGSNFGQFFYGSVPTTRGANLNSVLVPDGWFYFIGRTVVHEVKHIASQSARVANQAPVFESSWLEEGTARHAEELWVRESLHRTEWKANTGFGSAATNGLYCDFVPGDPTCLAADPLRRPSYGMRRHFNEIRDKLVQPWNFSPYGDGTGQSASTFYQTAWSLVRYTIDRYATSDAAFFAALTNASTNGIANLSAVAGVPIDQLIAGWGMALYTDDYPGPAQTNRDLQFPSWNLRNIYATLNALPAWSGRFPTVYPVTPTQVAFGTFASRVTGLRGGAHAYVEVSGVPLAGQVVGLRSVTGGSPSSLLRLAIVRLQ